MAFNFPLHSLTTSNSIPLPRAAALGKLPTTHSVTFYFPEILPCFAGRSSERALVSTSKKRFPTPNSKKSWIQPKGFINNRNGFHVSSRRYPNQTTEGRRPFDRKVLFLSALFRSILCAGADWWVGKSGRAMKINAVAYFLWNPRRPLTTTFLSVGWLGRRFGCQRRVSATCRNGDRNNSFKNFGKRYQIGEQIIMIILIIDQHTFRD